MLSKQPRLPLRFRSTIDQEAFFQTVFQKAHWAEVVIDQSGVVVTWNEKAVNLLESALTADKTDTGSGPVFCNLFPEPEKDIVYAWITRVFRTGGPQTIETSLAVHDKLRPVRLIGTMPDTEAKYALVTVQDLSDEKIDSQPLLQMAYYDQLTGLPNRYLLTDRLNWAIRDAGRHKEKMAVLTIDLDHFKRINDTYGHQAGDEVLQRLSQRMLSCLRESDTLARIGGDEFVVLMQHVPDSQYAALVASRILAVIRKPFEIKSIQHAVSASIGICLYPDDADKEAALLDRADIALYRAKDSGRSRYAFFNEHMKDEAEKKNDFTCRLRQAIDNNELALHYQPIVSVNGQQIIAVEALLRWHSAKEGILPAARFLPLAGTIGIDRQFMDWAMLSALQQMKAWLDKGLIASGNPCKLTVNLGEEQIDTDDFAAYVAGMLARSGLPADRLILEIREDNLMRNKERINKNLYLLKEMAIQLYLDDFSHGFHSLGQISQIPFSSIKIDQKMTDLFMTSKRGELLLSTLIELAHQLNLKIIAEGVETGAACQQLASYGCDALQGYWISKPLPAVQMELLLGLKNK